MKQTSWLSRPAGGVSPLRVLAAVATGIAAQAVISGAYSVTAQAIQLGIEYDPDPPFDAGSPEKAAPEIVEILRRARR
jgi:hypothetical protein